MSHLDPWYRARQHMVDAVVADLYGSDSDETLDEEPLERFIVGILHPRSDGGRWEPVEAANEEPDDAGGTAVDALDDPGVSFAHLRYPSTMGLTFGVDEVTTQIEIEVQADRYEPTIGSAAPDGRDADDAVASRGYAKRAGTWQRLAVGPVTRLVALSPGSRTIEIEQGLELRCLTRTAIDGVVSVTVVLVNSHERPEKGRTDGLCWFRPVIRVRTIDGEFVDRHPERLLDHMDADERGGELLYRSQRSLAIGHGVAVSWSESSSVTEVATTFFPEHDLALAKADRDDVAPLSMSELSKSDVREPLDVLVRTYEIWVGQQRARIAELPLAHQATARTNLDDARVAIARMRRGIDLLARPEVDAAFRVMNRVMNQQRGRQEMIRRNLGAPPDESGSWRPFQMAFILLNIEGLVDPTSAERDLADLLWFPTGGGKTEAYLGLIAFALVHRRLRSAGSNEDGAGVGVIMRYTLRLLTLQQFERAAGLICALESWRRSASEMVGKAPFTIGLWVGQGATPNDVSAAAKAIQKRRAGEDPGEDGDPVQLLRCPWCGTALDASDYHADRHKGQMDVVCPNSLCEFGSGDGLPVRLVDQDVYRDRPSLVIGTVDKFAMLAWREPAGRLFGSGFDAPPDLIVQDELHLISGPLGTLVGLYETAVDHLATDQATHARPKVVASTATIRRAARQVKDVFNREARQFPPPGIDAGDSFFAVDAPPAEKGTRRYVGLMAPSTSHATLLVRTYSALLQGAAALEEDDAVKDAYWTLLGYFNSLRVLGAAYIQSIDDVRDRIKVVAKRTGTEMRVTHDPRELTSRKKASEIPHELEALQTPYPSGNSPDVVLATNMISVGVDVDRLGLMAVMGQPQTTSEYIQATSRVGRRYPGLVFTLYNASRSRDLSHFESFTSYHRSLYKQVEATGATPFAPRALDRGLHGVLVILARHLITGAAADTAVGVPTETTDLDDLIEIITSRARDVDPDSEDAVRVALEDLIRRWRDAAEYADVDRYARWKAKSPAKGLLVPAGSGGVDDQSGVALTDTFPPDQVPWSTLTSLRNVDRESTLKLVSAKRTKDRS